MNRIIPIIICLLFGVSSVNAQTLKAFLNAAEQALSEKDHYSAFTYYEIASEIEPKRMDLKYNLADAARLYHAYSLADSLYQEVLESKDSTAYPQASYWLGSVKQLLGQYDEAINHLQTYVSNSESGDTEQLARANRKIEACNWALANLRSSKGEQTIERMGEEVNTQFSEFGSLQKEDTLYYSSLRFAKEKEEDDMLPALPLSKVLKSLNGTTGEVLDSTFNESLSHTAHITFNESKSRIYYTVCEYVNKSDIRCDLYYRDIADEEWGDANKLPGPINMDSITTTQPNVGYDEELGKEVLYFVSDRPGGKGKLDIWYSVINDEDSFTEPENLSAMNTNEDDLTPFFHSENNTLYFSSDGYLGFGGYDVFKSEKEDSNWETPVNLGPDINSSLHDVYYTMSGDESEGYFASNRIGSSYLEPEREACCYDIYKVTAEPIKVRLLAETFNKRSGAPLNDVTIYIEQKNGGVITVTQTTGDGNYLEIDLTRNKNYTLIAEKDGYKPDTVQFPTYRITKSIDIEKKLYLAPSTLVLEVLTFDKRQSQPLPNVTVTVTDKVTDLSDSKTNEFSHITYFLVEPGRDFELAGSRKGYRTASLAFNSDEVMDSDTIVKELYLELGNLEDFLPLAIYFDNDEPDPRSQVTLSAQRYLETYTPYYDKKDKFVKRYTRGLSGSAKGEAQADIESFFEDELRVSKGEFESFLNILDQYLDEGLSFKIFLKGFASPLASDTYNYNLGQRRISTIQNEFKLTHGGSLQKYFESGDLEVTEKSFGEETAPSSVSDDIRNLRKSIYSPEASRERRVEIIEIQKDSPEK